MSNGDYNYIQRLKAAKRAALDAFRITRVPKKAKAKQGITLRVTDADGHTTDYSFETANVRVTERQEPILMTRGALDRAPFGVKHMQVTVEMS